VDKTPETRVRQGIDDYKIKVNNLEKRLLDVEHRLNKSKIRAYIPRYSHKLASKSMKREIVREYCIGKDTLEQTAKKISRKYQMNVSPKTMRKYARLAIGANISRKIGTAKQAYRKKMKFPEKIRYYLSKTKYLCKAIPAIRKIRINFTYS